MLYPKYEKVNEHTIRIIVERGDEIPLTKLVENKRTLETKINQMQEALKTINEILEEAKNMGITPEEKKEEKCTE